MSALFYPKVILFSLRGLFREDIDRKVSISQKSILDTFVLVAEPVGRKPGVVILTVSGFPMFDVHLPSDEFEGCIIKESETGKCLLTKESIALWRNSADFAEQKMFASLFTLFSTSNRCSLKTGLIVTPDLKHNISVGITVQLFMSALYPEGLVELMSPFKKVLIRNTSLDALVVHRTAQQQVYLLVSSVNEYLMLTVAEFTQFTSPMDSKSGKYNISNERVVYMKGDDLITGLQRYKRFASLFTESPLCYSNMIVSVPLKEPVEDDVISCASFERVSTTLGILEDQEVPSELSSGLSPNGQIGSDENVRLSPARVVRSGRRSGLKSPVVAADTISSHAPSLLSCDTTTLSSTSSSSSSFSPRGTDRSGTFSPLSGLNSPVSGSATKKLLSKKRKAEVDI